MGMSATAESIDVRITGDASGATGAMTRVGEAVSGAVTVMQQKLIALGLASKESFGVVGESSLAAAASVEKSDTVIAAATTRMRLHFHGISENVVVMREHFEHAAKAIELFNAVLIGVGAVLAGGALFKESVGEVVKLTTETNKLASVYGITLAAASGLHETLHTLGIESDAAATMAMKLSRQIKAHEDALNADGIATRNASGEQLNLLEIQTNVIERLRQMEPGLQRNKVAIDAFGRGAGDLTKLLRLNDEAMREGMETAKALGIVVTKDGVESTVAYQHSVAEAKSVVDALWVAVGQSLIPIIKEMSDMLKNNGTTAVNAMRSAMEFLINVCREVIAVFATFDLAISVIAGALAELIAIVNLLGTVLGDVFTLHWSSIASDFKTGIGNIVTIAHDAAAHISADWAAMNMGWVGGPQSVQSMLSDSYKNGLGSGNEANPNTGDQAPDKAKKGKKGKADPSEMADLEEALVAKKLALDKINNADNTFREMSKAEEAKYWQDILARTDLSAKDRQAITRKYLDASLADKKGNFAAMIAMQQAEIVADKGNGDAKLVLARKIEAEIVAAYGKESKEAAQAGAARIRVEQEVASARSKLATETAKSQEALGLEVVAAEEAAAKHRAEMGQITAKELLKQELAFQAQKLAIQMRAIAAQIAAAKLGPDSAAAVQKLNDAKLLLERKYQTARALIIDKAELAALNRTKQGMSAMTTAWGTALGKMATLQAGFASTLGSMWGGIVNMVETAIGRMLSTFLSSLITQGAAQAIANAKQRISESKMIYLSTVKAVSATGAPPPIPQIAGAAAFAGALAFSAERGYAVPQGVMAGGIDGRGGTMGIVHPGEMILDEPAANNLRDGKMGGDVHVHVTATDAEDVKRLFMNNKSALAAAIKAAIRDGVR
jgi:hypothetical protein